MVFETIIEGINKSTSNAILVNEDIDEILSKYEKYFDEIYMGISDDNIATLRCYLDGECVYVSEASCSHRYKSYVSFSDLDVEIARDICTYGNVKDVVRLK